MTRIHNPSVRLGEACYRDVSSSTVYGTVYGGCRQTWRRPESMRLGAYFLSMLMTPELDIILASYSNEDQNSVDYRKSWDLLKCL